ncbi:hypothetical protein ACKVMT_13970 [Halobacteriales archaeon Cl-PHB]
MRRRTVLRSVGAVATLGVAGLPGVTGGVAEDGQRATTSRTAPDVGSDRLQRSLTVPVDDRSESFVLQVPRSLYDRYADRPRQKGYLPYATDRGNAAVVAPVVDAIRDVAGADADAATVRRAATGLVQDLSYVYDAALGYDEYQKYPVETLVEGAGDCEDTSALLAALLDRLGYHVALLALWEADHMAVGVATDPPADATTFEAAGTTYVYQETVEPGWALGEVPPNYAGVDPEVLVVSDRTQPSPSGASPR